MTTKRKQYEKPSLTVFELRQKSALLAGSLNTTRVGYGIANGDVDPTALTDGEWVWE